MSPHRPALLLALLPMACSSKPDATRSTDVATQDLSALFSVDVADDATSQISASFHGGDGQPVRLYDPDTLVVTIGARSSYFTEFEPGSYGASLDAPADASFLIRLSRTDGMHDVKIDVPPPFSITSPAPAAHVSRSAGVTIAWDPVQADYVDVALSGACVLPYRSRVAGSETSHTPSTIFPAPDREKQSCAGKLVVAAARAGTIDPAFGSAKALGFRDQALDVTIDP